MTAMREAIDAAILAEMMRQNIHGDSDMRAVTTAALTAIRAAGMVIVPVEPTSVMVDAVIQGVKDHASPDASGGVIISPLSATLLARAALDAAFAEMAGEK